LKPEKKKQLDRLIFLQRLRYAAIAGGISLSILAFMLFIGYQEEKRIDKVIATSNVHGTIVQAKRGSGPNVSYKLIVKLEDGRSVKSVSIRSAGIPFKGEAVDLQEMTRKSGRKNYAVLRLINH